MSPLPVDTTRIVTIAPPRSVAPTRRGVQAASERVERPRRERETERDEREERPDEGDRHGLRVGHVVDPEPDLEHDEIESDSRDDEAGQCKGIDAPPREAGQRHRDRRSALEDDERDPQPLADGSDAATRVDHRNQPEDAGDPDEEEREDDPDVESREG